MSEPALDAHANHNSRDHTQDDRQHSRLRHWFAPAWFLIGILAGLAGFAVMTTLAKPPVDTAALREAARDGTLDAIATMQAGGPAPESSVPPASGGRSFAERDANRAGDKSARVTIVEFSDFQ